MLLLVLPLVLCSFYFPCSESYGTPKIFLNDGNKMPIIALGTGRGTAKQNDTIDEVRDAVSWAIDVGYRHVDTAAIYGDEEHVGLGIADALKANKNLKREDLFVTTKLWNNRHGRNQVVTALRESLSRLHLDYVDLYLIHFPISTKNDETPDSIDYLETWKGMENAKALGLAKSIGVSNFNDSQLQRLYDNSEVKPAVNQIEVNPTLTQEPLVSVCKRLNVTVMAFSPFGFLVSRKGELAPPPRADDPALLAMAEKYGKSTSQIVLRYLIDRGLVPIPKSTNKQRIQQNIDIFDFILSDEEVSTINNFNRNIRVIHPVGWKEYPYYPFANDPEQKLNFQ